MLEFSETDTCWQGGQLESGIKLLGLLQYYH